MTATFDLYWFACDGPLFGIPHFWNVISNVPFLILGLFGVRATTALRTTSHPRLRPWMCFWVSIALLGPGSGVYHYFLTPFTLMLDRLCIGALTASLCWQALHANKYVRATWTTGLWIMLAFAVPILAWYVLDLNMLVYGTMQAAAAILILTLHFRRRRRETPCTVSSWPLMAFVACYAVAKLLELGDQAVCDATGVIGGHPFKHLASVLGLACLLVYMRDDLTSGEQGAAQPGRGATGGYDAPFDPDPGGMA